MTGRTRTRRLTYGSPACTIDFSLLGSRHFIALSGVQTKDITITRNTVGTTAAMTSTCRIPGFRAEDATVYYGKVTEEVSGDGLPHPVRTVYEYDTSSCRHAFRSVGKSWPVSLFGAEDVRMLGTFVPSDNLNPEVYAMRRKVFGGQPVGGYFREEVRDMPVPLTCKTVFVCEDGAYRPLEEERHHYVTYNPRTVRTGMYVEGIVRKCNKSLVVREDFQSVDDFDYFELTAHTARVFRDSTVYVRHYADGSTRRVSVGYRYNALLPLLTIPKAAPFRVDTFTIDTILFHPDTHLPGFHSASVRPLYRSGLLSSATYVCGPDTLTRYLCHSGNLHTAFYDSVRQAGCTALPVMEKWVYNGQDSVLLENRHARFGRHVLPASKTLYWNGTETERRDYLSYNRNGLPEEYSDNGLPHTFLVWGYKQQYLVGAFRNLTGENVGESVLSKLQTYGMSATPPSGMATLLESLSKRTGVLGTLYEYRPLVGVTRVTAPEGTSTAYGYTGGRLSSVTAPDGRVSEEYGYSLHCDSGANLVTTRHYLYGSQANRESAQYYDGFGLPWCLLEEDASPDGKYLLAQTLYDALYRRVEEWLPVSFIGDATEADFDNLSRDFYGDSRAFTSHTYEEAEDGRPVSTARPGEDFASHPATTAYTCNDPDDTLLDCRRYSYDPATGIQAHGSYPAGSLEVTVGTDEDGRKAYTFTDFLGRTVLVRRVDGTAKADTYTLGDLYGDPLAVIPPEAAAKLEKGGNVDDKELYVYTYDNRHLCTGKRFPGQERPVAYAYDSTNTLVASQSGNQEKAGKASFHLRDELGRTVLEGEFSCADLSALETDGTPVDCSYMRLGGLSGTGYEVNGLSLPAAEVRQACYYDTYAFFGLPGFGVLTQGDYMGNVNYARGKLTGEMRRADDGTCLYYAYFYDVMGNVVKTVSSDIRGEQEITETDWSFTGQPLTVRRTHLGNHDLDETYTYTYDVMDRPVSVKHRLGSNTEVTLAEYTYDALGRMKAKSVHNGTYSTEYAYNIRSWLTSISGSKFSQALHYEDGTGTPYHNGNLSSMTWKAGEEAVTRGYRFAYDGLDRLTSATYGEGGSPDKPGGNSFIP